MAYRHDGRPTDLSVDPDEILAAQRRSRAKKLLAVGAIVPLLAAGGGGTVFYLQRKARSEMQLAWSRAASCLVGDGTVAAPSAVYRNRQLAAMATPSERRVERDDLWPRSCAKRTHELADTARNQGASAALVDAAGKLAKAVENDANVPADVSPLVDGLFKAASAEKLVAQPVQDAVSSSPPAASPMTLATLPKEARLFGGRLTIGAVFRAPFSDGSIRFVVDDKDLSEGPAACELPDGARTIACSKIPAPAAQLSPALRPWGTTSPKVKPFVFAGDRGKSGIFRADTGARVVDKLDYGAYGASALEDGSLGYLVWNDKPPETHFVRIARDGARTDTMVVGRKESGNPYYSTSIFWQWVAYKSVTKQSEGIRLMLREIAPNGKLGARTDVGRIMESGQIEGGEKEEPHLTACRSGDTFVIRAKGWQNTFLTFLAGGKWTAPVEATGLGGELQCRPGEAIVTRIWGQPMGTFKGGVDMQRCTVSGCDDRSVVLHKALADNKDILPKEAKDIRAVDIDGKMLVLWSARDRGGVRMRLAPHDQIANAADEVLYDDHVKDGAISSETTLVGFELWPTQHGALLLLGTSDGVYAFAIDPSGKRTPVASTLAGK